MSRSQIEEAFAIAWGSFALALWQADAAGFIIGFVGIQSICSMIAAMVYAWKDQ